MSTVNTSSRAIPPLSTLLAAPHRGMFLIGALALLANMIWWTWALVAAWQGLPFPRQAMPSMWAHGFLMQYATLAPFVFGFLLTVFPRWMSLPDVPRRVYATVFALVLGGGILVLAAQSGVPMLLPAGLLAMLSGWLVAMTSLGARLRANGGRDRWAVSAFAALAFGALGLALALGYACGGSPNLMQAAISIGTFGLLVPVYFTVAHRMVPFFSNNVVPGYRVVRPLGSLAGVWVLVLAHLAFDLAGAARWRWLADLPLAALLGWQWIAWQPWKARKPGLLAVLYIALAWLPLSFALFAADSLTLFVHGASGWARAPLHALTIGFLASMLVAMVTRVTHGHSGRPLTMGPIPWLAFVGMQLAAMVRVLADAAERPWPLYVLAAALWLLALAPWVVRAAWIYLTPRRDGKPG
ncbi:NnrS family protein [Dyella solisilvae]|uniref:NnrS family protein n=1 Tax=Dyella solisilvae TaxID=1920168 RepID=A0A370K438_9GAMM|nr:NnrS family protein [Dyella solisilvae]RDI97368.1 NnrS family protein [Dyella solisilvae]